MDLRERILRRVARPPEQLGLILTGLVLVCLITGLAGLLDVQHRRDVLVGVADRSSPLAGAALTVYQSLSDADAIATGAFLTGDQAPADLRARYRTDITEAASALSTAAAGAPDVKTATAVAELTALLPMYTGIVEKAETNNLLQKSVGAAYLRESSGLVRERMLPVAQQLFRDEMVRLSVAQDDAGSLAWFPLTIGGLALIALLASQVYLRRTTNRTLNAGLLGASVAVVAALTWLVAASATAVGHNDAGREGGSVPLEALAEARITVLTARSEEALSLVARGNGQRYEDGYKQARQRLDGDKAQLGSFAAALDRIGDAPIRSTVESAVGTWQRWRTDHQQLRELDDKGEYIKAVRLATGVDTTLQEAMPAKIEQDNTGTLAADVDKKLGEAVGQAQSVFDDQAARAVNSLSVADVGIAILMLLACAGVAFGMAPRIREYR
ncbi:hypothetical protein JOF56_008040 [Kibdelosporangium banguiense]|uniref:Chemotaxis methyl-accepting receptor HlyB-like 4HB MCP domain-containing protein n=1 Tax=Kibdelosporangium banguiense TaxID=1365924 RepID=A0ABS4TTD4_9PSEU|nr:hypothetical protein [Kibdelosporangium banguiense]MBP2327655.1 hypothetical protein [Kibdelosporangium banguiense]